MSHITQANTLTHSLTQREKDREIERQTDRRTGVRAVWTGVRAGGRTDEQTDQDGQTDQDRQTERQTVIPTKHILPKTDNIEKKQFQMFSYAYCLRADVWMLPDQWTCRKTGQTEELSSQSVPTSVVTSPNTKAHGHAEEHAE